MTNIGSENPHSFFKSKSNYIETILKSIPDFPALPEDLQIYPEKIVLATQAANDLLHHILEGVSAIRSIVNNPSSPLPEEAQKPIKEILEHLEGWGDKLAANLEAMSTKVEGLGEKIEQWYTAACQWWEAMKPIIDKIKEIFYPSEPVSQP